MKLFRVNVKMKISTFFQRFLRNAISNVKMGGTSSSLQIDCNLVISVKLHQKRSPDPDDLVIGDYIEFSY